MNHTIEPSYHFDTDRLIIERFHEQWTNPDLSVYNYRQIDRNRLILAIRNLKSNPAIPFRSFPSDNEPLEQLRWFQHVCSHIQDIMKMDFAIK